MSDSPRRSQLFANTTDVFSNRPNMIDAPMYQVAMTALPNDNDRLRFTEFFNNLEQHNVEETIKERMLYAESNTIVDHIFKRLSPEEVANINQMIKECNDASNREIGKLCVAASKLLTQGEGIYQFQVFKRNALVTKCIQRYKEILHDHAKINMEEQLRLDRALVTLEQNVKMQMVRWGNILVQLNEIFRNTNIVAVYHLFAAMVLVYRDGGDVKLMEMNFSLPTMYLKL